VANRINIKKYLLPCNNEDLPDNLIAAAIWLDDGKEPVHAGIFIRYHGENKFFHYPGYDKVELEEDDSFDIDGWYFHKKLTVVDEALLPSILTHCEIVVKEAKPEYGYYYMGEMYDESGDFISHLKAPQFMTCVGICLNFLKYCLRGKDFVEYEDWDISSVELSRGEEFVEYFIKKIKTKFPHVDIDKFKKGIRRIWPIEYLTAAFDKTIPVKKEFTDEHSSKVNLQLKKLVA